MTNHALKTGNKDITALAARSNARAARLGDDNDYDERWTLKVMLHIVIGWPT